METRGYYHSISKDLISNKYLVTFIVETDIQEDFLKQKEFLLDIQAKKHREKRSLDANSYFHVLVDKLAKYEKVSLAQMKNEMIFMYGKQAFNADGNMIIIKTNVEPTYYKNLESMHWCWVRTDFENGIPVYFYKLYEGSHTYNSKEMSLLIDGTVNECKDRGIETMTPAELRRMYEMWGNRHG